MPLPWKKSKSSRISRFVSDFQQSPKHGGSLVVETGFPTSLIDLFVKNRNRLKKQSSKRNHDFIINNIPAPPPRRRVSSPPPASHPPPPSTSLPRHRSLPVHLDLEEEEPITSKIEEVVVNDDGDGGDHGGDGGGEGGGACVLMVVAVKIFMVAVLALSTKKLAVGVTLSAFTLLFLEFAVARVFTLFNICPNATEIRIDYLIGKLLAKKKSRESTSTQERKNRVVTFEIIEEPVLETKDDSVLLTKPVTEETEVVTIRDVVFKMEKSKSAKLKSKIVKKIVPKKLRSYKKKRKMKKGKEEEIEIIGEEEEDGSVTEVSSLYTESEVSERGDVSSVPALLESCEEEVEEGRGEDVTKVIGLMVIVLAGLLSGKVLAIGLTLSWCLILRVFCCKSRTSL